jgi:20S proteasome subunit beta 7
MTTNRKIHISSSWLLQNICSFQFPKPVIQQLINLVISFIMLSSVASSSSASRQHTTRPIVTGTSVLGLKYAGGVMLAADTLASYGTMAKYKNARRLERVDKVLIGAGGEVSDFQAILDLLQANALEEQCMSGLYEPHSSNAKETWNYLRSVMYNRRNKMNPLWNDLVVAGLDEADQPFLGWVDKIGTTFQEDLVATGFGSYLAIPLLREKYRPDLQEGEARALLEDCMRILFYRDCRASNRIQIAKVEASTGDILISEPYELDTHWDAASFVAPVADLDGDGGW